MFDSVRIRLTLWYACVLVLSLAVFALAIYKATASVFHEQQDESLHSTAQTVASAYLEELEEQKSVEKAGQVVLTELAFPERFVVVTDSNGRAIASSKNATGIAIPIPQSTLNEARKRGFNISTINGLRLAIVPLSADKPVGFASVAEPLSVLDEGLRRLRQDFFAGVVLVLLLASSGGYFLARKSLLPVASMNQQTQRITAENLSSRLDVSNPRDELGSLATTINDLLNRLEHSFNEQQRFIADASHELRTPLAVLRGETEVALGKARTATEYRDSLTLIKEEAERLTRIVEDLFVLARQPVEGSGVLLKQPLALNDVVRDCTRAAQVLADRKGVRLKTRTNNERILVEGDEDLLKRMVLNLLDNAVKFTPGGGEISVSLMRQNAHGLLIVSDTGVGIPEGAQPYVFDRFYRVDKARSRELGGAGLGLSIVSWIVAVHDGKITVESAPGRGTRFTVELPVTAGKSN